MDEGTNVIDELDELDDFKQEGPENDENQENQENTPSNESGTDEGEPEEDFLDTLLKQKGILDKTKIKFQNDDEQVEEVSWDSLSNAEKVNILSQSSEPQAPENGLDDAEIQLINSIRQSGTTPAEYLQLIQRQGIDNYVQNSSQPHYQIDDFTDDELFKADLIDKAGVTEEEAQAALDQSKANEELFKKQIGALRAEYKQIEDDNRQYEQYQQQQVAQAQFQQFSDAVVDQINQLTDISGYDLNMEEQEMQNLYDFITGTDAAGNNYFAKAMADPKTLVQTAWFALNGQQMIDDITDYFKKEISNVRKTSYEKGLADAAKKKDGNNVVFKDRNKKSDQGADLDDDF